jgi:tRNA(Arg) A34 adenosine deaminase TadA
MMDVTEAGALAQAIDLACRNGRAGQLPFGAVVVRDGRVIGTGVNTAPADFDPAAHAEVTAIRDAARQGKTLDLAGATVYSSCEPCAICRLVAAAAGVQEIVFGAPKEAVPGWIDGDPATTARLIAAVEAVLPGRVRAGRTDVDALSPFERS